MHNRNHPAKLEEPVKINIEPVEVGDQCGYLVTVGGPIQNLEHIGACTVRSITVTSRSV